MGTIYCGAGHAFTDIVTPSPHAWTLISDVKFELLLDELMRLVRENEDNETKAGVMMQAYGIPAYICPECGRMVVFENGLNKPAVSYKRED